MEIKKVVDSMSIEEILDVYYCQDAKFVIHKIIAFNKAFSKCLSSSRTKRFTFNLEEYKRKDGLNIVIQCFDMGSSFPTGKRLKIQSYFWFIYRGGLYAIRLLPEKDNSSLLYLYTPHFIDRYKERGLRDVSISKSDALNKFIYANHKIVGKRIQSEKYPNNFWLCYEEGIAFVEPRFFRKGNIQFSELTMKTFISWDSLSLKRRNISLSIFQEAISKGLDIKIPDEILDENNTMNSNNIPN